jgi:hypothetical protein
MKTSKHSISAMTERAVFVLVKDRDGKQIGLSTDKGAIEISLRAISGEAELLKQLPRLAKALSDIEAATREADAVAAVTQVQMICRAAMVEIAKALSSAKAKG